MKKGGRRNIQLVKLFHWSGAFKAKASGRESREKKERVRGAKCGKHEDAGRKSGSRAVGDQQRDGLTWLCQTSVITKHPKLHTLI